jgi:hypothetical protein
MLFVPFWPPGTLCGMEGWQSCGSSLSAEFNFLDMFDSFFQSDTSSAATFLPG